MVPPVSRRQFLAGAATAAAALTASCGTAGPTRPGSSGGPLIWAVQGGAARVYQDAVRRFNRSHPGQELEIQLFQNDPYKQKLRLAMGAGTPPDVFYGWGGGVLNSYVTAGNVRDLTQDLQSDPALANKFFPNVMQAVTLDDRLYGVPIRGVQPVVLFCNTELFRKHGVQPPRSWQDLLAAVNKFKSAGLIPIALGGQSRWTYLMWEEYLVDRIGGPQVFREVLAGKPGSWSHPAFARANTMIQQLVDVGAFGDGFASISYDTGQQSALLYTGKAAMELMGVWDFSSILESSPDFIRSGKLGWTTFPTVPGGAGDPNNVVGNSSNFFSVAQKSRHQDVVVDHLKSTVMDDEYLDALIRIGDVPPVHGIEQKLANADNSDFLRFVYTLSRQAPSFQLSWDQALGPEQAEAVLANLDQLFLKKITPQQFAATMNGTIG